MRNPFTSAALEQQLAAIPALPRIALVGYWAAAYGRPPPKGLSRRLLEYAAAWHLQAQALGGPTPALRRRLRLPAAEEGDAAPKARKTPGKALAPGSRLVRDWHGRTYTVEVLEQGFLCNDRRYLSLSEIAREITGARWSGPRFFGL